VYLRGSTDLMPAPRWRTWAFLLDSREGAQANMLPPPPPILPQTSTRRVSEAPRAAYPNLRILDLYRLSSTSLPPQV